jgi:putative ABC transport system ATP-binding protein
MWGNELSSDASCDLSVGDEVAAVDSLSRVFVGPPPVDALRPCTFSIRRGDYIVVTGRSGSGKTTLLSLLGLLDVPTSGRYLLDGVDTASLTDAERSAVRAHRIGFVFQAFHLLGYRTVLDNIELGLVYQGVRRAERRVRALAIIDEVGLTSRRSALCSVLSGGEKQRVAIARSLIRQPAIVLCDEPTGNLDTGTSTQILHLLDELHRRGLTIVVITHEPSVAERASRRFVISDGVMTEN